MMRAVQLLVLCTLSCVGALDIYIGSPTLLLDCRSHGGTHVVESISSHGDPQMVKSTASIITEASISPEELYAAARDGELSFINTAISQLSTSGLDLNWRNPEFSRYTALHTAASWHQPSIVAALLDAGADPDVQSDNGQTPMSIAAQNNHISVLRLLLDHKYQADVNLPNNNGWTPVFVAAMQGETGALELLLAYGGDPNKLSKYGTSPLMTAIETGGAPRNSGRREVEVIVRILIQAGAQVNYVKPRDGYTALHLAAKYGLGDVAFLLLQNGADKNKQDNDGRTAADLANAGDHYHHWSVARQIDNYSA